MQLSRWWGATHRGYTVARRMGSTKMEDRHPRPVCRSVPFRLMCTHFDIGTGYIRNLFRIERFLLGVDMGTTDA